MRGGLLVLLLAASCGAPQRTTYSAPPSLDPLRALQGDAFVADTAFLFPEVATEVQRGLLRAQFTLREATRLGLEADTEEVERSLAELRWTVLGNTAVSAATDEAELQARLEEWAEARYGCGWNEVRAAFEQRLRRNQLYQLVLRGDSTVRGGYRVRWFVSATEQDAASLVDKLRLGADPAVLMARSMVPNTTLAGERVAVYLPAPFAEALAAAEVGEVVGPARMAGDTAWRVGELLEILPAAAMPTRSELLEGLRAEPVGGLEARAWFEEMSRRYTAEAGPLPVSSPDSDVEHYRRSS